MAVANETQVVITASDKTQAAFKTVGDSFGSLESKAKGALAGIAAGFAVGALKSTFDSVVAGAAAMDDLAEKTGASVESLSKLSPVAKLAGTDMQAVGDAITSLTRRLKGLGDEGEGDGAKGASKQLADLGLSARTLTGDLKDPAELMIEIAQKLGGYRDGLGKTQVAQELFGKSGANLLPFLKDLAEYGELTARMTAKQAAEAENYEKNMKRLTIMSEAWKKEIAFGLLPVATALSEAFLENKKQSNFMLEKTRELKEDGSIRGFAEDGARGIAMVIDAARHGVGAFKMLLSASNLLYEGSGLAWQKFQNAVDTRRGPGEKKLLEDRARNSKLQAEKDLADAVEAYRGIPEFLAVVEEKLAASRLKVASEAGKKPALDGITGGKKSAGTERISELEKAIQASRERTGVLALEADAEDKVTESQKKALVLMIGLRDGKLQGTEAERAALGVALEAELAEDRRNEKRKIAIKQLEEDNRFRKEQYTNQVKQLEAVEAEVESTRKANAEIGLNRDQMAALSLARLDDTISIRQRSLANEEATGKSAAAIAALEDEIKALRELRNLRIEGAAKQKIADAFKESEDQSKRTAQVIEQSLTDALLRGFESGKSNAQVFKDTLYNMFRTLVLKPVIEAQVKPFAQLASQAVGTAGGGGLLGSLFGGGGGGGIMNTNQSIDSYDGGGGGLFSGIGSLFGFAGGGSFDVGGSGGTDSQVVAFRASPDERVTISTPGQQAGSGSPSVTVVNNYTIDSRTDSATIRAMLEQTRLSTIASIQNALVRSGNGGVARGMA